ncbi:MAG: hypothetical protein OXH39_06560 [Candidatus Poribacteria bacterium]|nr:hypothetical protein [Candidatus Poribacteria bacterium]
MRLISLMLCAIFILFGCGSDETSVPIEDKPNYFPDVVGNRWVYRNTDGLQWTLEVSGETNIEGKDYRTFKTTPPIETIGFNLLKPDVFRVEQNRVLFAIGEKIDRYVQTELPKAAQNELAGLELTVAVEPISHTEFIFLQVPLTLNAQWDALNIKVNGSIAPQNLALLQIPFEVLMSIKAEVVAESPLEMPAGNFEKTYQIEYQIEITHSLFSEVETTQLNQTVWFVPHVGIVKVEDEHSVTELVDYALGSTAEN